MSRSLPLSDRHQPINANLTVVNRRIEDLIPNPKNSRLHTQRQIRQIANSIEAFGFNVPVLVGSDLNVIAGHGRLLAARLLGWSDIPTICLDHLNEAQKRAFMIADNRLTENSQWDDKLLVEQLRELALLDLDFSLEATGFEMAEIDLRIGGDGDQTVAEPDAADVIPSLNDDPAVSRPSDLWILERHRIICADSTDPRTYTALMELEKAAAVFADPPYNVPIQGHASGLGAVRHREFAMACGEMNELQFTLFLASVCGLTARHSCDGAIHFVCMDWRHLGELLNAGRQVYTELKNICVWVKHNAGMGSFYRSQHELILVFKYGRGAHRNNVELGRFGRHRTNIWSYAGATSFGLKTEEGDLLKLHPTVKPVAMVADAILDCSKRGDVILDPFLGSGTTLIAAERTGRRCRGIEMDPRYIDTAIRRWQAFTGDDAQHATAGKSFTEVERERGEVSG